MIISRKANHPPKIYHQNGEIIQEALGVQAGGVTHHSLAKVILPPSKKSAPHFHKNSVESYFVVSGTAHLRVNGDTEILQEDDFILIEPNEVHQVSNLGENDLILRVVYIPTWHPDDSYNIDPLKE